MDDIVIKPEDNKERQENEKSEDIDVAITRGQEEDSDEKKTGWLLSLSKAEEKQRIAEQEKKCCAAPKGNDAPIEPQKITNTVCPPPAPCAPYIPYVSPAMPQTIPPARCFPSTMNYMPAPTMIPAPGLFTDVVNPVSVLCSRSVTEKEYILLKKQAGKFSFRISCMGICSALLLVMALLESYAFNTLWELWPFIVLGFILCAAGFFVYIKTFYSSIHNEYLRNQVLQDTQNVVELYNDRIEKLSNRMQITMKYSHIRIILEMPELIALIDSMGRYIVLRAEDMTPYDAQWIRTFIYPRVGQVVRRYKGETKGRLASPLPIPILETHDAALMAFPVTILPVLKKTESKLRYALLLFFSVSLLGGAIFANLIYITPSVIADMFIHMGLLMIFEAIVIGLLYRIKKSKLRRNIHDTPYPSGVSFTKRGMIIGFAGMINVIPWSMLECRETEREYVFETGEKNNTWILFRLLRQEVPDPGALTELIKQQKWQQTNSGHIVGAESQPN